MNRKLTIIGLGPILIVLGLYFFPLGEDVVFYYFLDYAGGDYWIARLFQYVFFAAVIAAGVILVTFRQQFMANPVLVIGLFVALALIVVMAFRMIGGS